jgi:hypothetical protein
MPMTEIHNELPPFGLSRPVAALRGVAECLSESNWSVLPRNVNGLVVVLNGSARQRLPDEAPVRLSFRERWLPLFRDVMPLVLIFVIVVMSMTRGWAAPTEASAVGATATLAAAALYRALTRKRASSRRCAERRWPPVQSSSSSWALE